MTDELKRNLDVEQGYAHTLEQALTKYGKMRARLPFVVLDKTSTVRYADFGVSGLIGFTPSELVGKSFEEFLSPDLYESALRNVAYRIDVLRQRDVDASILGHKVNRLAESYEHVKKTLGLDQKAGHVKRLIAMFEHRTSQDVMDVPSTIRVKKKDGSAVTLDDRLTLYKHPTSHGRLYAGAVVELALSMDDLANRNIFVQMWHAMRELPGYQITSEYVVDVENMFEPERLKGIVSELIADTSRLRETHETLVLDFSDAERIRDDASRVNELFIDAVFLNVRDLAQEGKLVVGNASKAIRAACAKHMLEHYGKKSTPLRFTRLIYPSIREPVIKGPDQFHELKTYRELETHIDAGLAELHARVAQSSPDANRLPEPCVPEVPRDPEGQGHDLPAPGASGP